MAFKAKFPTLNYNVSAFETIASCELSQDVLVGGHKAAMTSNGSAFILIRTGGVITLWRRLASGTKSSLASWTTTGGASIDTDGTYLYLVVNMATTAMFYKYAQDGTQLISKDVCPGQTGMGLGCDIKISPSGKLCMCFNTKNASYPNTLNIGTSQSTDGGNTWSAWLRVTTYNSSLMWVDYATIAFRTDGYPIIAYVYHYNNTPINTVYTSYFNGSTWTTPAVVITSSGGSSELLECTRLIMTPDNTLHLVFFRGSTGALDYRSSTNNGLSWGANVTIGNDQPNTSYRAYAIDITYDASGKLFIMWMQKTGTYSSDYNIRTISFNGAWSAITTLTWSGEWHYHPHYCRGFTNFTTVPPMILQFIYSVVFRGDWIVGGWAASKVWVKIAGVWKLGTPYSKMGGVWKAS